VPNSAPILNAKQKVSINKYSRPVLLSGRLNRLSGCRFRTWQWNSRLKKNAWTDEHKQPDNLRLSPTVSAHITRRKTNIQGEGKRSVKAKRERGEEINNLGSTKGQKNARHQTKHESQNKGDKMLLMCVEGARGPLLYQNWEAKPGGKKTLIYTCDFHF